MSDSELPPLEDASDIVNRIKERKARKEAYDVKKVSRDLLDLELKEDKYIPNQVLINPPEKNIDKDEENDPKKKVGKKPKKSPSGFGGFQTGFLNSKPKSKKKTVKKTEEIEEIITPKAKKLAEKENPLIIPEVQEQMKKELQDDSFLSSYEKDAKLMKQMADPRFARAIQFMQKDPAACKEYYMKNDPAFFKEFIEFFQKNMQRIGSHMENKAEQQVPVKTEDEIRMEEILKRPDVKSAISDPTIQSLLANLKTNPSKAQKQLATINEDTRQKIQVLIRNGLLQLQ